MHYREYLINRIKEWEKYINNKMEWMSKANLKRHQIEMTITLVWKARGIIEELEKNLENFEKWKKEDLKINE